jgi:Domain of unknown function (DUF4760)
LITVIIVWCFWYFYKVTEIRDLAAIFSIGLITTTLFYHSYNYRLNYEVNVEKLRADRDANRNKLAFDIAKDWMRNDITTKAMKVREFIDEHIKSGENHTNDLTKKIQNQSSGDIREAVVTLLNYFELVAISIENDTANEVILKEFFMGTFKRYNPEFEDFIKERRKTNPEAWIKFEQINKKWAQM